MKLLRVNIVARRLGVSHKTVYRMVERGELKGIDISRAHKRSFRIFEGSLEEYIKKQGQ